MHHTVVRWSDPDPKYVSLLSDGGITAAVVAPNEPFEKACRDAGIAMIPEADLHSVKPGAAKSGECAVVAAGLWPGVHRPDPQTAGATRSLWMDQNCSLIHYLRAMYPQQSPVLGYRPDKDAGVSPDQLVAYDALELALVDAWVAGGNYLMALHPSLREALLNGKPQAVAAWRKLGRTAKWLRVNEAQFRQAPLPMVTVLVDGGDFTQEIAHLTFRQNVSPNLIPASDPPAPDPVHRWVMVAVSIEAPKGDARKRILASAQAGSTLVVDGHSDGAWWRVPDLKLVKSDAERNYYSIGKGQLVAYKEDVEDPGMFALDVIDILTQKRRPARIWNCNAGLVMASQGLLNIINYSRPTDQPVLARIQGTFRRATLLTPEAGPLELKVSPRGTGSEVEIPKLERVATVAFK